MPTKQSGTDQQTLLNLICSDSTRTWDAEALIDETGLAVVDVIVALAHLTFTGRIEREAVGRYRAPGTAKRPAT